MGLGYSLQANVKTKKGTFLPTATRRVNSIRSWWRHFGSERYPSAPRLTITGECGDWNGNRPRLWRVELQ